MRKDAWGGFRLALKINQDNPRRKKIYASKSATYTTDIINDNEVYIHLKVTFCKTGTKKEQPVHFSADGYYL